MGEAPTDTAPWLHGLFNYVDDFLECKEMHPQWFPTVHDQRPIAIFPLATGARYQCAPDTASSDSVPTVYTDDNPVRPTTERLLPLYQRLVPLIATATAPSLCPQCGYDNPELGEAYIKVVEVFA
jgi:hypothetical protein